MYYNNIFLRPLELKHINQDYLNWFKDKNVQKFIIKSKINTINDLKRYFFENYLNKNNLLFGIFVNKDNHIGNIKVRFSDNSKKDCSIGILIGNKDFRNKGIGRKSLEILIHKIYKLYNTKIFKLGVSNKNLIAINSYRKAGFIIKKKDKSSLYLERDYAKLNFNKFSLGTAQMGMKYGIVNKQKKISHTEFKKIINISKKSGITSLDTSSRYGDIENSIGLSKLKNWDISTKLPPAHLIKFKKNKFFYINFLKNSLKRLKCKTLYSLLIHRPSDLLSEKKYIFKALDEIRRTKKVKKIGLSLNTADEFNLIKKYPFDIIQTPLNFFDQRILDKRKINYLIKNKIEIQARSIFLQGLGLCDVKNLPSKFKKYKKYWIKRDKLLKSQKITSNELAINFVYQNDFIDKIIIGVDNIDQLKSLIKTKRKTLVNTKNYAILNKKIISPYLWKKNNLI